MTIDRGMLPNSALLSESTLPESSRLSDKIDPRRVRALLVAALEQGAEQGHTLLPRSLLLSNLHNMPLEHDCPVGPDVINGLGELLSGFVEIVSMADNSKCYQLKRFVESGELIRSTVRKRLGGKSIRHHGDYNYGVEIDNSLGELPKDREDAEIETKARIEKAAALQEIFESRFSVLIGAAGTGKTTLLKTLCRLSEVKNSGVLLLAPTGKARVQLESKTGITGGMTIAQFLMRYGNRFDSETNRYLVTGHRDRCREYRTIIVDECSMLTEEQLAALLDALVGVDRLVLVGDSRQLPPIGSGRPFVDIVREVEPDGIENKFPQFSEGYAKLTIQRRQVGATRADLLLADWFSGNQDADSDELWDLLETENFDGIRFESWTNYENLHEKLLTLIAEELHLDGVEDEYKFEISLGASDFNGQTYFWPDYSDNPNPKAEKWQILSPVRGADYGVANLNRVIQQTFRKSWLANASRRSNRKINSPAGPQGIIYGDKVINLKNSRVRSVFPTDQVSYVANGDVGIVVGFYKKRNSRNWFKQLNVEFTSQPGASYTYDLNEFRGERGLPSLELAYALTIHKSQGSEFGITFVILPDPCWPLSRELLYTALTRQQEKVIILHQNELRNFRRFGSDKYSDIARRLTNLFADPDPVQVDETELFLEASLIHKTIGGDLVRSKSEVIIANALFNHKIDHYEYEAVLLLPDGKRFYPDFTIIDDNTGIRYYWEHLGLLHDPYYKTRWRKKLEAYRNADILPYEDGGGKLGTLIVTQDDERGGIDSRAIADLISQIFTI